jgi:hypothetical protein
MLFWIGFILGGLIAGFLVGKIWGKIKYLEGKTEAQDKALGQQFFIGSTNGQPPANVFVPQNASTNLKLEPPTSSSGDNFRVP